MFLWSMECMHYTSGAQTFHPADWMGNAWSVCGLNLARSNVVPEVGPHPTTWHGVGSSPALTQADVGKEA